MMECSDFTLKQNVNYKKAAKNAFFLCVNYCMSVSAKKSIVSLYFCLKKNMNMGSDHNLSCHAMTKAL